MVLQRPMATLLLAFLIVSLTPSSMGGFTVQKNSLRVMLPDGIKGTYDSAIAKFGRPKYVGSVAGVVLYPKDNKKGCQDFDDFGISFKAKPGALPTFVLVDRGDCFFSLKVWNAQKAGASVVLVADEIEEPLITMYSPEEDNSNAEYRKNITIPSALIQKSLGKILKKVVSDGEMINVNLKWRKALPHLDDHEEYELWTNSSDECSVGCDTLMEFVKDFRDAERIFEEGGDTKFIPHYMIWYCREPFIFSEQCRSIRTGYKGKEGKEGVVKNLRQLCVFKGANETNKSWLWWTYVPHFQSSCPMREKQYMEECVDVVITSLGFDMKESGKCMVDPNADSKNPTLNEEQYAKVANGSREDVTISPTHVINNQQYQGRWDKLIICATLEETIEPSIERKTQIIGSSNFYNYI